MHFLKYQHECIVMTETPSQWSEDKLPFEVHRTKSIKEKLELIRWADIVFSNGASLNLLFLAKISGKPFVWKHAGYQASCIDGLGWHDGEKSPQTPIASFRYHLKKSGMVYAFKGGLKLFIRRFAANLSFY